MTFRARRVYEILFPPGSPGVYDLIRKRELHSLWRTLLSAQRRSTKCLCGVIGTTAATSFSRYFRLAIKNSHITNIIGPFHAQD